MSLPAHILVVRATVDPAIEAAWNEWYDRIHLPEILACPGFRTGRRYAVSGNATEARRYLALYEIDGPHVLETPEFQSRRGWGPFVGKVEFETTTFAQLPLSE